MRSRLVCVALAVALQAGCYNYAPLRRSELSPSIYLAVTLTEAGSEELAPYIGPNVLVVRGRFLSATDRGLILSVSEVENRRGDVLEWKGESVGVPGEFVRSLEERHPARGKAVMLAGVSLAGFFVAYAAFGPGVGGTSPGGTGGGPTPR